jgi:hypothetical protein
MKPIKNFWRALGEPLRQAWFIPRTLARAAQRRRQQMILNEQEIERLDRIRNPSKYRGK